VLGIFTGEHFKAVGRRLPCGWLINSKDGTPMKEPPHPVLAEGKVRYVGDRSRWWSPTGRPGQGRRRADRGRLRGARRRSTPPRDRPRRAAGARRGARQRLLRLGHRRQGGHRRRVRQGAHVTSSTFRQQPADPQRDGAARRQRQLQRANDEYTLYVANQNPHVERLLMCAFVLGIPEHKMRVIAPDVGGGFGSKIFLYAEETALVWASASRSAARSSGPPSAARPSCPTPTAATTSPPPSWRWTRTGKFLALRVNTTPTWAPTCRPSRRRCRPSCTPRCWPASTTPGKIYAEVKAVFTNTAPVDAYRGAGRPEATYVVERMVETAARELGMDPARSAAATSSPPSRTPRRWA
jgi:carbon-monoxide dehydrogenase large subunit